MPNFSGTSLARLRTCHPQLQALMTKTITITDFSILCGHRGQVEQELAVKNKVSKVHWPNSKHNAFPSLAVDIAPYPIDWSDLQRFHDLAKIVIGVATEMGIKIRWGGDWDGDGDLRDQTFNDLPHFELIS